MNGGNLASSASAAMTAPCFRRYVRRVTTLRRSFGRILHPRQVGRVIATLIIVNSSGQALGPFLAGVLSRATIGPGAAVLAAATAVGTGGASRQPVTVKDKPPHRSSHRTNRCRT